MRIKEREQIKSKEVLSVHKDKQKEKVKKSETDVLQSVLMAIRETLEVALLQSGKTPEINIPAPVVKVNPNITVENPHPGPWKKMKFGIKIASRDRNGRMANVEMTAERVE